MWKVPKAELHLLYKHCLGSKFIIETGTGITTKYIARAANESNAIFYTIDIKPPAPGNRINGVIYRSGWSVSHVDLIKPLDKRFVESHYSKQPDRPVIENKNLMKGETDLIRKIVAEENKNIDFFFCDTGEYCGLAEWNIVKDMILSGGKIACHDIYYPKSIKCFQIVQEIENSKNWKVLEKTESKQGLFIAEKM